MITNSNEAKRIETRSEVDTYLDQLKYSLTNSKAKLQFQKERLTDTQRDERFTNRYTVGDLFPDEDPVDALKRELLTLRAENYIETVTDTRFPRKSEVRVCGKRYGADVYIKFRVDMINGNIVFVMSFHYAVYPFSESDFPYN